MRCGKKSIKCNPRNFGRARRTVAIGEARVGEVLAMPIRPGVFFEPEVIGLMSEALEAACKLLPDASQHEMVREVMARRIIAVASIGERDRVRLRAAALAGRHAKLVEASDLCHSRQKSLNRFGANAV